MENRRASTENEIIKVALKVFTEKGYKGATMRDIAKAAKVNLAMLNYYFRSKENLFDIIFEKSFLLIYEKLMGAFSSKKPLFEKISAFSNAYIDTFIDNPAIPNFIFNEITHNPAHLANKIKDNQPIMEMINTFQQQIDEEVEAGTIKPVNSFELLLNLLALSVFPFIAKPMLKEVFGFSDLNFGALLERRKTSVARFVINAIKF